MRVTEVWFHKKKDKGNGFEEFHFDYKNIGGGSNDVSFTVNVNLGKLNEGNDIATMNILSSNEEPSVLSKIKEGGDDEETISTRKRRDQSTTKIRFTSSQVRNAVYKRRQLLHGLPEGTR